MSRLSADAPLRTPVLFVIFNRPGTTRQVFERIRSVRPRQLFVAADGPRPDHAEDVERCRAARAVIDGIDWDCELGTRVEERNRGLKHAVASAIDWFFERVPEGIVLEDDCLPSRSFFWFCQAMLERYRDDERVMQIAGNNYLMGRRPIAESYYFSKLNDIWGWATWRRAWRFFDLAMPSFPRFEADDRLADYVEDPAMRAWFMRYFEAAHRSGGIWSTAWTYAMCARNGLTIVPRVNLVRNIGLAGDGMHAGDRLAPYASVMEEEMNELVDPPFVLPDRVADRIRFDLIRRTDPRAARPSPLERATRCAATAMKVGLKRLGRGKDASLGTAAR